jgi:aspartyl-tRNA(Asn)/glutamyl-tRNA(Gln) amidotransferase subunit A
MVLNYSIKDLHEGLTKKKFSSVDLVKESFATIEKINPKVNACITTRLKKDAIEEAKKCDKERHDDSPILFGIPFVMKDSYITKGIRTTAASNVLGDFIPPYNATVYEKLRNAGAILIAKMNMDAWGHGGSTENTDFGPVCNPFDISRVAGGSGGGPAVAIATGMAAFAIGEDTGGSIRNPASWCNVTGLKVTYGRVSRYGCIAYASSFDTVGPTAKTAQDCAYVLETIAGRDQYDATCSQNKVPSYSKQITGDIHGFIIGIPKELFQKGLDNEIKDAVISATKTFECLGVQLKEVSMPLFDYGIPVYYLIAPSETSSNLARFDGVRYGNDRTKFTEETMRRIMIGTYALSAGYYDAYYRKAQKGRTLFIHEYEKALSKCDALIMPVMSTPPPVIGDLISDPLKNYLADAYTITQNPVGVPSLAFPCGFTKSILPIGAQLVGKMFSEDILLQLVYHYQKKTDWHTRKPYIIH